jgi:RNA recognition motif-containing protein
MTELLPSPAKTDAVDEDGSDLKTLFVSGLPVDITERELFHIFNRCAGFEDCRLQIKTSSPVAFVSFFSGADASRALGQMNGYSLDPENQRQMRCEMAKANMKPKRLRDANYAATSDPMKKNAPAAIYSFPYGADWQVGLGSSYGAHLVASSDYHSVGYGVGGANSGRSNPPMDTIFIANMSPEASEDELKTLLSGYPGFKRCKLVNQRGVITAFAQFEDIKSSAAAIGFLQGRPNLALDSSGLRVEYSKKPMGVPGKATLASAGMLSNPAQYGAYANPAMSYYASATASSQSPYGGVGGGY